MRPPPREEGRIISKHADVSLIAISIPNLSFKTATDGSTVVCTQQQLSDFRSEFSKKNEPERRSGLKKKNRNAVPVRSGPIRTLTTSSRRRRHDVVVRRRHDVVRRRRDDDVRVLISKQVDT